MTHRILAIYRSDKINASEAFGLKFRKLFDDFIRPSSDAKVTDDVGSKEPSFLRIQMAVVTVMSFCE